MHHFFLSQRFPALWSHSSTRAVWSPQTGTHLHLGFCLLVGVQVFHNAVDAERPGETQQVGQVAEGAAEQDGTAKGAIHGAPDGRGALGVLRCLRGWRRWSQIFVREHSHELHCSPSDPRRHLWATGSWWALSWRWATCRSSSALLASYALPWWEDSSTSMWPKQSTSEVVEDKMLCSQVDNWYEILIFFSYCFCTLDSRLTNGCRNRTPKSCKSSGGFTFWGLEKNTYFYKERRGQHHLEQHKNGQRGEKRRKNRKTFQDYFEWNISIHPDSYHIDLHGHQQRVQRH